MTSDPLAAATVTLSPARVRLALLALALGGFAIGCTEFVAMGLLPNIARQLIPTVYAISPANANAQAGLLISAYAAGVVVGAPTIAALAARFPRKGLLLWLLVAFTVCTVASAVLPSFGLVLAARFLAGLPHGAYFGVAALVAASLMGPNTRGIPPRQSVGNSHCSSDPRCGSHSAWDRSGSAGSSRSTPSSRRSSRTSRILRMPSSRSRSSSRGSG